MKFIKSGGIPIITGFQGINSDNRLTTIGRGGSDASAIMIAKFFKAEKSGKNAFCSRTPLHAAHARRKRR